MDDAAIIRHWGEANPLHHCDTASRAAMDNARNATGGL